MVEREGREITKWRRRVKPEKGRIRPGRRDREDICRLIYIHDLDDATKSRY